MTRRNWFAGVLVCGLLFGGIGVLLFGPPLPLNAQEKTAAAPEVQRTFGALNHWFSGWIRVRYADEQNFSDKTKKVGYEAIFDPKTGNVVYVFPELNAAAAAVSTTNYELRMLRDGETFQAVRFQPRDGIAWKLQGWQWAKLGDPEPLPLGQYEVQLIEKRAGVTIVRIDRLTGKTWYLDGNDWKLITEPAM